jgi:hypothetical protein
MKQPHHLAGCRIHSRDIRTFVSVAVETRQREVVRHGLSSVLARHDVIELEWRPVQSLWHPAVFATPGGTLPDLVRQSLVHGLGRRARTPERLTRLGLEKGQKMAHVAVVLDLRGLFLAQFALLSLRSQFVHPISVGWPEVDIEEISRRLRRQIFPPGGEEPIQNRRLGVRSCYR